MGDKKLQVFEVSFAYSRVSQTSQGSIAGDEQ
jgi:hypothetical protein